MKSKISVIFWLYKSIAIPGELFDKSYSKFNSDCSIPSSKFFKISVKISLFGFRKLNLKHLDLIVGKVKEIWWDTWKKAH